jgi:hypothetical protein
VYLCVAIKEIQYEFWSVQFKTFTILVDQKRKIAIKVLELRGSLDSLFISYTLLLTMLRIPFPSLLLMVLALLVPRLYGFCVYNNMSPGNMLYLEQTDGYGNLPTS